MEETSRRQFIKSCMYLAVSGVCFAGIPLYASGCGNEAKGTRKAVNFEPSYLKLHRSGELKKRGEALWALMERCSLCPRYCATTRLAGSRGFCQASSDLEVASFHPHFGEEKPLVGKGGSGAIFFTHCALRCVFCINWDISHEGSGSKVSIENLAEMMLNLQKMGCHNINFVTPTHYSPHILLAVDQAAANGLKLPLVYNTCGWENLEVLRKLDGVMDIYLPDFKYADGKMASLYSAQAFSYPEVTKQSLLEMHRQVGVAKPAKDGVVYRGLMIRHLVMPNNVGGTKEVISWIAGNLPKDTYLNIMSQYRPAYKAHLYPAISRRITSKEYREAVEWARKSGLTNLDLQTPI